MRGSLLRRQFYFSVITLSAAVGGLLLIFSSLSSKTLIDETSKALLRERILFDEILCDTLTEDQIDSIAKNLGNRTKVRFTVILPDGRVIADSEKPPSTMENHADRPEIITAMAEGKGVNVRYSETVRRQMVYSAGISRNSDGEILYVVRSSKPMDSLKAVNTALVRQSLFWGIILIALASAMFFISRMFVRKNIDALSVQVKKIAGGNFEKRLSKGRYVEFEELEKSVNSLAGSLEKMFGELQQQRNNLLTILQSLDEGVIVLEGNGEIHLMNKAAQDFTKLDFQAVKGADILSTLIQPELRSLIEEPGKAKIEYSVGKNRFKARKNKIPQLDQTVISINDITESFNIQQTKTDFVANVSHELKTPLTLIKGFAETLEMEPLDAEVQKYIATIMRHTDRMIALVKDLLTLSRIEQTGKIDAVKIDPATLVEQILFLFKSEADEKGIAIRFEPQKDSPQIFGDESLLEIAVSNLLHNAIKYTPPEGEIKIRILSGESSVTISIEDNGIGIPAEDIPRIFERFYTVDKSRSNSLYGTGLGLSIVKHIALLHSGEIAVESSPGAGSRFDLKIPISTAV